MITKFERYQIKSESHSAGLIYYRAYDLQLECEVNIKGLANIAEDIIARRYDLEREAHIRTYLSHPVIPKLYDAIFTNEYAYLISESIIGKDLQTLFDERRELFPVKTIVQWMLQLCDALSCLHNRYKCPVIVGNINLSNIMLDVKGQIRLIDLSCLRETPGGWSRNIKEICTPNLFAAPEQNVGEIGPPSDIYALGIMLYYLLTGQLPHHQVLQQEHFSIENQPIRKFNPSVPPLLEVIVMTALDQDPTNRFPSGESMRVSLSRLQV